ncbi:MAG: carbohydrate kinase [Pseudonocardiales bacterium]|nr:carbohydrate kinase [Pseudonocardiales bacterium]
MSVHVEPVTPTLLREHALPRPDGHKSSRGHVVAVGGSRSTPGALLLAGVAALRSGAGVLALAAPEPVAIPLAVAVPEASVISFAEDVRAHPASLGQVVETVASADAVLIGPGLDDADQSQALLTGLLNATSGTIALDAFALGVWPEVADKIARMPERLALTPNTAEAARLLSVAPQSLDDDPVVVAVAIAKRWKATVSYNGIIANARGDALDTGTGHAGLGTSGSGDVMAGCVAGLLARGADPLWATVWATYLHGAAGDRLAARVGQLGFLARELLEQIPLVMTELQA